ncbi:hypothetical protein LX81_00684 [Palleronia aestuarii]|uniref:Aminoglycoside phosphotransferase domain-containing protein n=1 Tax=Palleronia aestuarii TaxID=568105 RepID=A0A2W7NGI6_9RHOB|nr:phosphotransferase [Palleronia aestuarii]PZX18990.1 hypothetical protein LX81_00684 [Palleronia aestuarii]
MPDRAAALDTFLAQAGWGATRRHPLAGDASRRRYLRLARGPETAILMDADPANGEDIAPFRRVRDHLSGVGISVPAEIAADPEHGFLLMEDLGDGLFVTLLDRDPHMETDLYAAATDALAHLQRDAPPHWAKSYDAPAMAAAIRLARDWYLAGLRVSETDWTALELVLEADLAAAADDSIVLLHRDYHVQNLVWLPEREGIARVGMLDFQDALAGHPAYDLVSLLQDARRDVPQAVEREMIRRFAARTGRDPEPFARAYAVQGAQRQLRLLGIFAKLAAEQGKTGYLELLPRVWGYLLRDLDHPALGDLKAQVHRVLPAPYATRHARSA